MGFGEAGIDLQRLSERSRRLALVAQLAAGAAVVKVEVGVLAVELERVAQGVAGLLVGVLFQRGDAEVGVGFGDVEARQTLRHRVGVAAFGDLGELLDGLLVQALIEEAEAAVIALVAPEAEHTTKH